MYYENFLHFAHLSTSWDIWKITRKSLNLVRRYLWFRRVLNLSMIHSFPWPHGWVCFPSETCPLERYFLLICASSVRTRKIFIRPFNTFFTAQLFAFSFSVSQPHKRDRWRKTAFVLETLTEWIQTPRESTPIYTFKGTKLKCTCWRCC